MISADCSPVENGLNCAIGRDSGPFGRADLAVGKIGPRQVAAGAVGEGDLAGQRGRIAEEGRASRARSCARRRWRWRAGRCRRCALEKNAAVRAFCSDTSVPKIGASGERTSPSTAPLVSTTAIVTCARLSSGWRICARARLMIVNASSSIARTSAAVSGCATVGAVGAGADREAVVRRSVGQDEGVGIVEFGGGRGADARRFGAIGLPGEQRGRGGFAVIAAHRDERARAAVDRRESGRARRVARQPARRSASMIAQRRAVDDDPVGA